LLAQRAFDDERLKPLLVSIGKGFGILQISDEVEALNRAGKVQTCKEIYMGISGLSEENSRAFFQSRGWANSYTVAEISGLREVNQRATRTMRAIQRNES
jgi:hypothetical protein